ncbi:MAG: hypothetical protein JW864_03340 [Spirochaetes bacterium]|nr:hypothetical protein [Spirochaetota bacterium]
MKLKKTRMVILACFLLSFLVTSVAFSQEKPASDTSKTETKRKHPREDYAPDQRPEENYLARFKAIEVSEDLMQRNLENIYILNVIVSNFKENGWQGEYDKIYAEYKKAVSKYYRRQVIYSRLELERNKKNISELFKKIVVVYQDQAQSMLEKCADKILDFSLDEKNKYDPNRSKVLFQNMMRLWIAYGQIDDADRAYIDNVYKTSVYHLRIAKSYAISILEQLDPENKADEYKVHKADNLNRILTSTTAKSESPKSESGPSSN